MKSRNIFILALVLISIFMISAASAAEDTSDSDILNIDDETDVEETSTDENELDATDENSEDILTSPNPQGEITVTHEVSKSKVKVGEDVKIKISIKNTGTTKLDLVRITPSEIDNGLVFKSYEGASWNQEPDDFIYADELLPGQTATLYLTYAAEKTGTLDYKFTATTDNSEDVEVSGSVEVSEDSSASAENNHDLNDADTKSTGNPIFLLLLAVCSIVPFRKLK